MEKFLGELASLTPYEDMSKELLIIKCHEMQEKWLSEQKVGMELAYECEQQSAQIAELKAEIELLNDALKLATTIAREEIVANDNLNRQNAGLIEAGKRDAMPEVEQEPVAFDYELLVDARGNGHYGSEHRLTYCHPSVHNSMVKNVRKLYDVPPSPPVPEGWKLVPIEPTEEMELRGAEQTSSIDWGDCPDDRPYEMATEIYNAMLAAAPLPEGD